MELSLANVIVICQIVVAAAAACIWIEQAIKYHFQKKINEEMMKSVYGNWKSMMEQIKALSDTK